VGEWETRRLGGWERILFNRRFPSITRAVPHSATQIWSPSLLDALETVLSQDQIHDGGK
jgi:hypothetical protein